MNDSWYDHKIQSFTNWKIKNYLAAEHAWYGNEWFGRRISTAKIDKVMCKITQARVIDSKTRYLSDTMGHSVHLSQNGV